MRKFKRLTLTLALLLTAVGGAWAQTTVTWDSNTWADWTASSVKTHTVDGVTITTGGTAYAVKSNDNLYIYATGNANTLTFSSDTPITRIEMTKATPSTTLRLTPNDGWSVSTDGTTVTWEGTATKSLICETCTLTVSKIKFYLETAAEPTELELTPDETGKTWTLAKMPASNVELQVEYEPTKVTMAANDNAMGTVEVAAGESKVEWTADTWKGWTYNTKEYTVGDITMTSSPTAYIQDYPYEGQYKHSLDFFVDKTENSSTVTFSTTGDPFSRIEFTMINDYSQYNPSILPIDNWTIEGKSAVWEGEATKSLTLQSCSTSVSKITFYKGAAIPDGVTVNGDGTFTVVKTATVTLKATPAEGYKFLYWEDDQTNTNPVREVTIESGMADMTYKAVFAEILYNVTFVEGTNLDEWTATPATEVKKGTKVDIKYNGTKKVIGVKVEEKKADNPYATAKLGDLFYSDGTFSTELEAGKTPIGVIAYLDKEGTDDDEISEKSNGAGHGLVLCLKNAASNVVWSTNTSSQAYTGNALVTDVAGLKRSEGVSGYSATAALATDATTYPVAAAAKNYTTLTAPTGTTGWFLPSAQQLVKMIEGLGGLDDGAPNMGSYFDNNHEGADKWENALSKAGSGNYDSMTSDYLVYWSSSENSVGYAVILAVDARSTGTSRGFAWLNYGKDGTSDMFIVRPVLAF